MRFKEVRKKVLPGIGALFGLIWNSRSGKQIMMLDTLEQGLKQV